MGGVTRARARRPPPRASPRHTHPLTRRSRVVERSRARSDGVQPPRAPPRARDVPNASHRDREVFFMYSMSPDSLCTPTTRPRRGYTHAPARPTDRARERYDPARRRALSRVYDGSSRPPARRRRRRGDRCVDRRSTARFDRFERSVVESVRRATDGRGAMRVRCARGVCDGRRARVVRTAGGGGARGWIGSSVIFRARVGS